MPSALHQPRNPSFGAAYRMLTPAALTSATAGDHIDSSTTSLETMRFTESVKADQNARNWPCFLYRVMILYRRSISARVGLPKSLNFISPSACAANAASCAMIPGSLSRETRPFHFVLRSSAHDICSGRLLITSAL